MNQPVAETRETPLRQAWLRPRHAVLNIGYLVLMHGALLGWLWFGAQSLPFAWYVLLSIIAATLHQRVLSEWFHEATHWNLVPGREWNDRLADLLIGTFNGTRVRSNRPGHFAHHAVSRYFGPDDPDTAAAAAGTPAELRRGLLRDLTGRTALSAFLRAASGSDGERRVDWPWYGWLALVHGAGFGATLAARRPELYFLYFVPLLTLYPVANRLRLYAQHAELRPDGSAVLRGSPVSRTCHAGWLEQVLLQSPMIMYHHEHHARPALPYRALRQLAMHSTSADPAATRNSHTASGFQVAAAVLGRLR